MSVDTVRLDQDVDRADCPLSGELEQQETLMPHRFYRFGRIGLWT